MNRFFTIGAAMVSVCLLAACTEPEPIAGGWTVNDESSVLEDHPDVWKSVSDLKGYEPVALLGSQVVAGTNYSILVKKDDTSDYAVAVVYENLEGKAQVTSLKSLAGHFADVQEAIAQAQKEMTNFQS